MTFLRIIRLLVFPALLLAAASGHAAAQSEAPHSHAIAMHGEPALPPDFTHLPYVNPDAPRGGFLRLGVAGSFDSLNTMAIKGNAPTAMVPYIVQPLMMRSADEPFTLYGLVAETIATPEDRSYVEFRINPLARFSDGHRVSARDVEFSWNLSSTTSRFRDPLISAQILLRFWQRMREDGKGKIQY